MLVLIMIEILLVPGSRTSDFLPHIYIFLPGIPSYTGQGLKTYLQVWILIQKESYNKS